MLCPSHTAAASVETFQCLILLPSNKSWLPGVGEPWNRQCQCLPELGGRVPPRPQVSQGVVAPVLAPRFFPV